mmetsp:Transcript_15460/g.33532  ORF Transcript_15460/g.33532 Transcript_15460/m.33532 type:complete len:84 (-) Transcript_15460:322-573(-)
MHNATSTQKQQQFAPLHTSPHLLSTSTSLLGLVCEALPNPKPCTASGPCPPAKPMMTSDLWTWFIWLRSISTFVGKWHGHDAS